ncbi:MAG: hypothetical protein CMI16_00500 [Opitutaceae bacterium]|nr:hypothetical protein [Opitutaceae bacterium]|tara:strand:+ start:17 stop:1636 length:1620 start_codon:yes stop_codon:yes gene_type:complete
MAVKSKGLPRSIWIVGGCYLIAALVVLFRPGAILSSDDRTVIRFAHWQAEAGPREAMDALIERYEELNPDVRVVQLDVPGRVYTRWVRTQLIGETAPDLIEFSGGSTDIAPRFFEPITKYVDEPNPYNIGTPLEGMRWRDTFVDGLNTPSTYIDRLSNYYAVTMCSVTLRLFYNPDLLEEITGSHEPPHTYDDMRRIQKQVTAYSARIGKRVSLYAGCDYTGEIVIEGLLARAGIGVGFELDRFREQGSPVAQMAQEFMRGHWDYRTPALFSAIQNSREAAPFFRPGFQQLDRDAATQEFLRSQALMFLTGTWDATTLKTMAPFEVGVDHIPWPAKSDHSDTGQHYWSPVSDGEANTSMPFYLNKQSKNKDVAMDFMRFVTSLEGNTIWMNKSGWNPSIRGVELLEDLKIFKHRFEGYQVRSSFMRGFGVETREVWQRLTHHLTAPNGGVEKFMKIFEKDFPPALRKDVESNVRVLYLSLRRDVPALVALATLDRLVGHDAKEVQARKIRESSQNLTEAKMYEAEAVLARGSALLDPLP